MQKGSNEVYEGYELWLKEHQPTEQEVNEMLSAMSESELRAKLESEFDEQDRLRARVCLSPVDDEQSEDGGNDF